MQKKLFNRYTTTGVSDTGNVRQHNEDNILIDKELGLLLVADGMGGHEAGEVASSEAIKIIQQMLHMQQRKIAKKSRLFRFINTFLGKATEIRDNEHNLEQAFYEANNHIYQLNIERNAQDGSGMGTTVAGCWVIRADLMLVFHIGDSRVYRFRNQKLERLTKDHSVIQEWHDNGCNGEPPKSNVILKAVGPFYEVSSDIQTVSIKKNDTFLICSDGLTDMVEDSEIERKLNGISADKIESFCQQLLESSLEHGGKDNVSIILMT